MAREMKDSGIEWIGEIPSDFRICRLKHILEQPLMYGANKSGIPFEDSLPRYIRITDITSDGKLKDEGKLSLSKETASDYILDDGDLLFARSGATVGKAFLYKKCYGLSAFAGYLIKARVKKEISPEYIFYYTQSTAYEEWKRQIFIQSTIQNIGADRYDQLPIPLPEYEKQLKVVSCLEMECSRIDSVIEQTHASIDEYKKLKQAVITQAVTKGIRPDRPMKDSGVEWIGIIPESWHVAKLKYFASIRSGITLGKVYPSEIKLVEYPYLRVANVQGSYVDLTDVAMIKVTEEEAIKYRLKDGELLMTEGGDRDKLGRGTVWHAQIDPCLHQNHVFALRTNEKLLAEYVSYLSASFVGRDYFDVTANQSVHLASTNSTTIMNFTIPYPSTEEQKEIVDYLDDKTAQIDQMISEKMNLLSELDSYKKSLIYEYVTGKKEVPS